MPHDRDGNLLAVGDFVYVPCVVKSITEDECDLETVHPDKVELLTHLKLKTKQLIRKN